MYKNKEFTVTHIAWKPEGPLSNTDILGKTFPCMAVATLNLTVYLAQAGVTGENKHKEAERSSRKTYH